jgi:hypothetical protein
LKKPTIFAHGVQDYAAQEARDEALSEMPVNDLSIFDNLPPDPATTFNPWRESIAADPNYLYHATNRYNLNDIVSSGKLATYEPSYGTDQDTWPDGSAQKRSYWTHDPEIARSFYPAEGQPTLLRAPRDAANFRRESTGDHYLTKPLPSKALEIYTGQGAWRPLTPPQAVTRPPVGLMGQEEQAEKMRAGYTPPQD